MTRWLDFGLTTKVQVSGWRFLLRRVEHAIVRRDTRMFDDPLQFYSRAVSAGIIIAVLVCLGAALLAYFKPLGKRGGDTLLVDRTTNELYVWGYRTGQLRPVYNLTLGVSGARQFRHPVRGEVRRTEQDAQGSADRHSGDPHALPPFLGSPSRCGRCATRSSSRRASPRPSKPALMLPLVTDSSTGPMRADQGVLVLYKDEDWLVTEGGRHAIDLSYWAVTSAVGIPVTAKATPISEGLFNALPNAGPWGPATHSGRR